MEVLTYASNGAVLDFRMPRHGALLPSPRVVYDSVGRSFTQDDAVVNSWVFEQFSSFH